MNGARFPHREADTGRLRTVIAAIDRELALLPTSEGDGVPGGVRPAPRDDGFYDVCRRNFRIVE